MHLRSSGLVRALLALTWLVVGVYAAELVFDVLSPAVSTLFQKFASCAVFFCAAGVCALRGFGGRGERTVWRLFAAGLLMWGLGTVYYAVALWDLEEIPVPSWADVGYLGFYLPVYVALGLLFRSRVQARDLRLWLDGVVGALAIAAIAAAVVFDAVLASTGGSTGVVAVGLAYPLADLLILLLVVGAVVLAAGKLDRAWAWIAGGLAVFAVTDSAYLYMTAVGTYAAGSVIDAGWSAAAALIATAAWQPAQQVVARSARGWRTIVLPIGFALVGLALLLFDHFKTTNLLAVLLAIGSLLAVLARLIVTFADNMRMVELSETEASTDALTGLGNRRRLMADLATALRSAGDDTPLALATFDLDGFKAYNDTFGHPAGDELLARLGRRLADVLPATATAYRMGGDEFCLLAPIASDSAEVLVASAARALCEHGESFSVTSSYGTVLVPHEAREASDALALADQRMYRHKNGGRVSADRQTTDALLQALAERHPDLGAHGDGVAALAAAVARRMDVPAAEREAVRLAAELHDIGKVAVPTAILTKPGPLDDHEWAFMRRHTLIGERILLAAPALNHVARIVRSSHERMDGRGYPDGLAGEEIPLAARIVAVCDAYDAMLAERPYQRSLTPQAALAELERCAGSQFDPEVVAAFVAVLAERREQPLMLAASSSAAVG